MRLSWNLPSLLAGSTPPGTILAEPIFAPMEDTGRNLRSDMKTRNLLTGIVLAAGFYLFATYTAVGEGNHAAKPAKPVSAKRFDALANAAIAAMRSRATELHVTGVAVVSYAPGDTIQGWTSRMAVVGRMKDEPSATAKGNNLIGIAYAKSAEMADTLQNSGTASRPPMTGEFGWQGGVTARGKTGRIIVAFSGGRSEDDVQVSRAGLAVLQPAL